ncbi:MAG: ABC transporter ATP-binding protein [Conexibacter sp.]
MASISIEGVSKTYPDGTVAVSELDLQVEDGMFVVLVGPSGCGKTTLLRMIAGLESITGGQIRVGDRVVNDLPPQERDMAMVFQSYALYPHMSVRRNIGYGLRRRKLSKPEIDRRVHEMAGVLELSELLEKKPGALSGGQRQRVAMGRAIVREPQAFLMDEPLSNLDAKLRTQMRAEIARLQQDLGTTTIYVTHDQTEAMTLGDLVCVMNRGEVQQAADPQTLFNEPANVFVADFVGSPAMNTVAATLERREGGIWACFGAQRLAVPDAVVRRHPGLETRVGQPVAIGIRPEDIGVVNGSAEDVAGRAITFPLELRETFGRVVDLHFDVDAAVGPEARFVARVDADVAVGCELGQPLRLCVATDGLRFFDLDTGATLSRCRA